MQTVRSVRRQSIPPPLRATMLRLLRLPFSRSLRFENSRNPAWERRYADFSDTLHFSLIVPWFVGTRTGTNAGQVPPSLPAPHGIAAGTG